MYAFCVAGMDAAESSSPMITLLKHDAAVAPPPASKCIIRFFRADYVCTMSGTDFIHATGFTKCDGLYGEELRSDGKQSIDVGVSSHEILPSSHRPRPSQYSKPSPTALELSQ